jgi:hypothetical protein
MIWYSSTASTRCSWSERGKTHSIN